MSKRKMCLVRCNLHGKEGRQNEKSDSSSFAVLGILEEMIRFNSPELWSGDQNNQDDL
jgi:hypothetical protein